jgi:hypothetical protein
LLPLAVPRPHAPVRVKPPQLRRISNQSKALTTRMRKGLVANAGGKPRSILLALLQSVDWSYSFADSTRAGEKCRLTTRCWLGSNHAAGELPGVLGNALEYDQELL